MTKKKPQTHTIKIKWGTNYKPTILVPYISSPYQHYHGALSQTIPVVVGEFGQSILYVRVFKEIFGPQNATQI